jgi:hypothetical protein
MNEEQAAAIEHWKTVIAFVNTETLVLPGQEQPSPEKIAAAKVFLDAAKDAVEATGVSWPEATVALQGAPSKLVQAMVDAGELK